MSLLSGLYPYEVVLLVLGVVFFAVLLFVLIYQVTHGKSLASLSPLFVIPIVMIGYPSVQQIQYKGVVVTVASATKRYQADPTDVQAKQDLMQSAEKLATRADGGAASANGLAVLATAQYALDDEQGAKANLRKALEASPAQPVAIALQQRIQAVKTIGVLTARVQAEPTNAAAVEALKKTLGSATVTPVANPQALIEIAHAQAALGNKQEAERTLKTVQAIKPGLSVKLH